MSLLPNAMRLPDDVPLHLGCAIRQPLKPQNTERQASDWEKATASDKPPKRVRLRLTDEAQAEADDFRLTQEDRGCVCFTGCAPCSWCTHPGNPLNLEYDDAAWVLGYEGTRS